MAKRVDGTSSSLHQPKEGGRKRKSGKDAGNYDQQLEELEAKLKHLKDAEEELVKAEKELKSRRTASELQIERIKFRVTSQEQETGELKSKITASEQKTERLKSKITVSEQKTERIKSKITAQEQEINELKSSVPVLEQETDGLRYEETALEQKIDGLKSEITDLEQCIKMLRSVNENMSMDIDSPKDMGRPVDRMDIDSEEETDALFTLPPPKRLATNKLITQGKGNSQTEVLEPDNEQIQAELAKIDNKIPSACRNEELATNKHATAGKSNRKMEGKLNEVPKGKLLMAIVSSALVLIGHLLSTAGSAESREATLDKQASTSALSIKGTTDVPKLVKIIWEACDSYLEEKASPSAQIESRAVNAEEEDSANQAKETSDDDN